MSNNDLIDSLRLRGSDHIRSQRIFILKRKKGIRWENDQEIGRGSFGVVWLQKNPRGQKRALKEVEKKYLPEDFNYKRELLAMAKLSKVLIPIFMRIRLIVMATVQGPFRRCAGMVRN